MLHCAPKMPGETLTSCWTTSGIESVAPGATPTPKALIGRRQSAICWTSNDDGVPMSVNTLNDALRIMGCDTGPGGDHCTHGLHPTRQPCSRRRARSTAI